MNLKKFLLLMLTLSLLVMAGCGGGETKTEPNAIKIGMLRYLNASEKEFNVFMEKIFETFNINTLPHEVVYFDNLNSMQMALESGQIDEVSTYLCVSNYLIARNPKIEVLEGHTLEFIDAFCLAMRENDVVLRTEIDGALSEMRESGLLDNLTREYINNLKGDTEPPAVDIANIPGADTIKVAITGDLPPLDLVRADGKAAGFNTAVLAEIGRLLGKNIELVQVDSSARAAALTSGQVDVVFWAIVPVSEIIPANADKPAGVELTAPYYRGKIVHIGLKKD
ncbi:MAG: transporter substrate-binding domain-containing protein [Selenomonadaceae bacterium]|nr:transporter substrate-binding domain-containing protein [Selenomonadaceae bacterium]